jgi:transposase InsO family protein
VKFRRIDELRQDYPIAAICPVLDVSESGDHAWRKRPPSHRATANRRLALEFKAAHEGTRQTYGPERLQADLADNGIYVGIHWVRRIRKKLGLRSRQKRKFKATTDSNHRLPVAPNLLDRQFAVTAPNRAWVTDITYIATDEGWLYLAGIEDHRRFTTREQTTRATTEHIEIFYNRIRKQARLGHLSPAAFSRQYDAAQRRWPLEPSDFTICNRLQFELRRGSVGNC